MTDNGPLVDDFDGDGFLDVFVAAGYSTYSVNPNSIGRAYMIKGNTGTCPSWRMFRYDHNRSGYLPKADVDAMCGINTHLNNYSGENPGHINIQPNPFTESFSLQLPQYLTESVTISLFDISGKLIWNHYTDVSEINKNTADLHYTPDLDKPGLYFYTVKTQSYSYHGKLIKMPN
jgi:hypothetical protein